MFRKIGFIGTGNMGSAVAKVMAKCPDCPELYFANRTREKAETLARGIGRGTVADNAAVAADFPGKRRLPMRRKCWRERGSWRRKAANTPAR